MAGTLTASIVKDPSSGTDNITLGATGNVTLGAAATVTGAASVGGQLTIGSSGIRMVNGSNTTNIVAPSTAVTTTLTLPATTGTVALTSDITGGFTSLGTINTTSGTSQTLSGLTLTNYRAVYLVWNGVISNNQVTLASVAISGSGASGPSGAQYGTTWVDLTTGAFNHFMASGTTSSVAYTTAISGSNSAYYGRTGITTASTSISVGSSGGFSAGSVLVYGVK